MDLFDKKGIKPMLISEMCEPFNSRDYIFELKLDGERCIAYLDKDNTLLQNKRNFILNTRFPELNNINKSVKSKCILDGEITVLKNGKPDFSEVKRRSVMTNRFKVELAIKKYPANFTAFDILYYKDKDVTDLPLIDRKKLLSQAVNENERIAVSRYIEEKGIEFYKITEEQDLEGIVAKKKDSKYFINTRTKDWIKIKNLKDDDFVICGYIQKENNVVSLILGQYRNNEMIYKGHVTLGVSREDFNTISNTKKVPAPNFEIPKGNENAVWIKQVNVCTVKFMEKTISGGLRQPIYKGLRDDKLPNECVDKSAD